MTTKRRTSRIERAAHNLALAASYLEAATRDQRIARREFNAAVAELRAVQKGGRA